MRPPKTRLQIRTHVHNDLVVYQLWRVKIGSVPSEPRYGSICLVNRSGTTDQHACAAMIEGFRFKLGTERSRKAGRK